MRLQGRAAVVTGAGSGIGQAICEAFVREGAAVVLGDIDGAAAERVAGALREQGGRVLAVAGDVAQSATAVELVARCAKAFGGVDIVVNNAGAVLQRPVVDLSDEDWDRMLRVDLYGPFYGSREAMRAMVRQGRGGRIIQTSSLLAVQSRSLQSAYSAAKAGLIGFSRSLAIEAGPHGITVNCVLPGHIRTPLTEPMFTPPVRRAFEERIPLHRLGEAAWVADVFVFLASDEGRYVTGQAILVDGGYTISGELPGLEFGPTSQEA